LCLQRVEHRDAPLELRARVADVNAARLRERDIDAGLAQELVGQPRPLFRGALRPASVLRETCALPLDPDQTEIGARRPMRDIAFVEERELRSERTQAECDSGANEPAADHGDFERRARAHAGCS